jgi:hypothetical protein
VASSRLDQFPVEGIVSDAPAEFFFHTREKDNPWLEIDLQASTDHRSWKKIARQDQAFDA